MDPVVRDPVCMCNCQCNYTFELGDVNKFNRTVVVVVVVQLC